MTSWEFLRDFLHEWGQSLVLGSLGVLGATTTVLVRVGAGRPVSKPTAYAALLSGGILAMTSSGALAYLAGISVTVGIGLGGWAYITGLLSLAFVTQLASIENILPRGKDGQP